MPEYRYTHEYRNDTLNATIIVKFVSEETAEQAVDLIGEQYLNAIALNPAEWYLDDVQSEEVA